jgi:hypothetical protein
MIKENKGKTEQSVYNENDLKRKLTFLNCILHMHI